MAEPPYPNYSLSLNLLDFSSQPAILTQPAVFWRPESGIVYPGTPLQTISGYVYHLIPTNFVPVYQQVAIYRRSGIPGSLLELLPQQFVFVPHRPAQSVSFAERASESYRTGELRNRTVRDGQDLLEEQADQLDPLGQSEVWQSAYSLVVTTARQIMHYLRHGSGPEYSNDADFERTLLELAATHLGDSQTSDSVYTVEDDDSRSIADGAEDGLMYSRPHITPLAVQMNQRVRNLLPDSLQELDAVIGVSRRVNREHTSHQVAVAADDIWSGRIDTKDSHHTDSDELDSNWDKEASDLVTDDQHSDKASRPRGDVSSSSNVITDSQMVDLDARAFRNRLQYDWSLNINAADVDPSDENVMAADMIGSMLHELLRSLSDGRGDLQGINSQRRSLRQYYNSLVYQFYYETFLWLYLTISTHPRSVGTWALIQVISGIAGQPPEDVAVTMLAGFLESSISQSMEGTETLESTFEAIERDRDVSPEAQTLMREYSVIMNIRLDPRGMLRRFTNVIRQAARSLLIEAGTGVPTVMQSPGTRRRSVRDRHHQRNSDELPEQQSFQVPLTTQHIHPASLPLQQQQPVIVDVDQVQGAAAPVTRAPYAIPVCTRPHVPICTTGHIPVCATTQPTWSFPACSVQLPTCSIQHIPACSIPQVPLTSHPLPPMFSHSHPTPQTSLPQHHPHHRVPPTQFNITPAHQRRPEEDVTMLADHRPPYHQIHHTGFHHHHPPTLNPSPPLILQEPAVHPSPQDIFGPFQRFYAHQRSMGRSTRLRNFPPPPPPYPGFLLHFLAMLGNPPVPPYGRDLHDDATEVENYEALLNLAERLGEAKPRGLVKAEIEQLPAYRFNGENQRSVSDQTSCVVCMCDFENRQLLRVLPCSHEFHAKCVDKWLKTNRTCPICRADASEIGNQSD